MKENSRKSVDAHGGATYHGWLWLYGKDGTIYWIDPTWTDNAGYVWWGIVENGKEVQLMPSPDLCKTALPDDAAFAYYNRGNANKNQKRDDQAIEDYDASLRLDPNNAGAYVSRGMAYAQKKMWDRALADFNQAIKLDPNNAMAYLARGAMYIARGGFDFLTMKREDISRARADFTRAIQIDPNMELASNLQEGLAFLELIEIVLPIKDSFERGFENLKREDITRARGVLPGPYRLIRLWSLIRNYSRRLIY